MKTGKNTYQLINPVVTGNMDTIVKSRNSFGASKKLYKKLSEYSNNHVDNFYMTIKNVVNGKLSHFSVHEQQKGGKIDYTITNLPGSFSASLEDKMIKEFDNLHNNNDDMEGGRSSLSELLSEYGSDDSSSSSEDVYAVYQAYPITNMVYFHLPYYKLLTHGLNKLDRHRFCLPMFSFPNNPRVEIRLDLYSY